MALASSDMTLSRTNTKVVFIPDHGAEKNCQVFTLGDHKAKQWRNIQAIESHLRLKNKFCKVCINGAIYFLARTGESHADFEYKVLSFDVRSEKFYHVDAPKTLTDSHSSSLINYQGKLGLMRFEKQVEIWVMEDDEKKRQRWSKIFFYEMDGFRYWKPSGVTRGGGI